MAEVTQFCWHAILGLVSASQPANWLLALEAHTVVCFYICLSVEELARKVTFEFFSFFFSFFGKFKSGPIINQLLFILKLDPKGFRRTLHNQRETNWSLQSSHEGKKKPWLE